VACDLSAFADTLTVYGTNDIYAAGHSTLPATIYPLEQTRRGQNA